MKEFNIKDYGARFADCLQTKALQATIDACFLAGGFGFNVMLPS